MKRGGVPKERQGSVVRGTDTVVEIKTPPVVQRRRVLDSERVPPLTQTQTAFMPKKTIPTTAEKPKKLVPSFTPCHIKLGKSKHTPVELVVFN
jgi:hypothetical protein